MDAGALRARMPGQKNPHHIKQGGGRTSDEVPIRDLEARNEAIGAERGMGVEEPRNIRKAGGGVRGKSMGGAHVGRYGGSPAHVTSKREPKPRGRDKD